MGVSCAEEAWVNQSRRLGSLGCRYEYESLLSNDRVKCGANPRAMSTGHQEKWFLVIAASQDLLHTVAVCQFL
jgi:hypothetical protein